MKNRLSGEWKWKLMLILAMVIFGFLGLTNIKVQSLSTGVLCMLRGFVGAVFVFLFRILTGRQPDWNTIGKNFLKLALSGIFLGLNWAMLFMSFRYLDTSVGGILNYMAPMIVIFVSPFLFREKLSWRKLLCVLLALIGLVLIFGILGGVHQEAGKLQPTWIGFLYGAAGAIGYALMYILNKKMKGVNGFDRCFVQLFFAGLVMIPYVLIAEGGFPQVDWNPSLIFWTAFIAIIQTGVVYVLYYSCIEHVPAQTTAIFSYIDPVLTVTLGILVLGESPDILKIVGAVQIIGAAALSEFVDGFGKNTQKT